MRGFLFAVIMVLVSSCGAKPPPEIEIMAIPVPPVIEVATYPEFDDTDAFEWTSYKPTRYPVHGIDVARYQGDIDWMAVRKSGVSFAYIKATEGGDHLDDNFAANWRKATRAGLPRGAYHYYYFCRTAPEQARWFIKNVPIDPKALPPVLDIEWNPKSRTCQHRPLPYKVRRDMRGFLAILHKHYGKRPLVYVTPDFYQDNQLWRLSGYHFWLRSVADHPQDKYPGQNWLFWQYTGTGVVPGIQGNTDINAFAGSPDQWRAWLIANLVY